MKKIYLLLILLLLITGCKAKTYTVTFVDDTGKLSSIEVEKGKNIKDITPPVKEGYIFVNWLKNGFEYDANTPITEDITLTAKWTEKPDLLNNHTVIFNFGNTTKTQTVKDGEKVPKPQNNPKKEKHTFLGWYVGDTLYDFDSPVTKDIALVAKFEKNRITIKYDLNGGGGTTVETEIDKGSIPKKPNNPTKFGYNFSNWSLDDKPYNFDTPLYEDVTIKALWIAKNFVKVTYDTDGGNELSSTMLEENSTLDTLPTASKDGYIFKYWSLSGSEFKPSTKVDKDITLVAVYEKIEEPPIENEENQEDN